MTPVLELTGVIKDYRGLRPLRIEHLIVAAGEQVALLGVDQPSAEMLIHLITGATLPDRGVVIVFGRSTAAIEDSAAWLSVVDRFGIVSERAVLLDALSVLQNLAVPFSLDIEPPRADVRMQAARLALEVGLEEALWDCRVADLDGSSRLRVRLGRALALDPAILLLDHATARVPREGIAPLGPRIRAVAERRGAATVALTADRDFAASLASRVLSLDAATGRLTEQRRGWLARLRG